MLWRCSSYSQHLSADRLSYCCLYAHSIINGYKQVLTEAAEATYFFSLSGKANAFLADLSAFAAVALAVTEAAAPAEQLQPKRKSKNKSDEDMDFGLFD